MFYFFAIHFFIYVCGLNDVLNKRIKMKCENESNELNENEEEIKKNCMVKNKIK